MQIKAKHWITKIAPRVIHDFAKSTKPLFCKSPQTSINKNFLLRVRCDQQDQK